MFVSCKAIGAASRNMTAWHGAIVCLTGRMQIKAFPLGKISFLPQTKREPIHHNVQEPLFVMPRGGEFYVLTAPARASQEGVVCASLGLEQGSQISYLEKKCVFTLSHLSPSQ